MEQTSFDIESRSRNTDGRSPVQPRFSFTIVTVDFHEKICKIISLLSQALVLALSLVKAMMCTHQQGPGNNRIEHMLEEEQLILQGPGQLHPPEPENRNR